MLKIILQLFFAVILGLLAYDISQTGSFNKSQTYQFLKENGVIEKGDVVMKEAKKSYNKVIVWAEKNIPVYYNETSFHLKPYLNLGREMSLVLKSNVISFTQHAGIYINKNYPAFQDYMSVVLKDTISSAKGAAHVISQHVQHYAETVIQYANNVLSQR